MHRLIGKPKPAAPAPTLSDATKLLNERSDTLDGRIAKLDAELVQCKKQLKNAKGSAATNIKSRAMNILKRKRMLEKQRDGVQQQAFNLDQQAFAIDNLKNTASTVAAMKAGAKEMKKEYKNIDVDKIEDLQDDMHDLMLDAEEVNEIMGRSYGVPDEIGDDDLEAELAGLGDEFDVAEDEEVPDYLKAADFPGVPTGAVKATTATATPATAVEVKEKLPL
jgi:charged multivesicular body protein 5